MQAWHLLMRMPCHAVRTLWMLLGDQYGLWAVIGYSMGCLDVGYIFWVAVLLLALILLNQADKLAAAR